jgi:hypothetical protein
MPNLLGDFSNFECTVVVAVAAVAIILLDDTAAYNIAVRFGLQ